LFDRAKFITAGKEESQLDAIITVYW